MEETIKNIRHDFFSHRNGIVADTLKKSGLPYKMIFGLQLPEISGIAQKYEPSIVLADSLWNDVNCRESRLLACYLFPKDKTDFDKAMELASSVLTTEEADILCFRLLRYLSFAPLLLNKLQEKSSSLTKNGLYCTQMLEKHLKALGKI